MANKKSKQTGKRPSTQRQADNLAEAKLLAKFGETIKSTEKIIEENKEKDQPVKTGK